MPGREFIIDCDASTVGLGAVLARKDDKGRERLIAFASQLLRENEKRCSTTELEAYAVVWRGWKDPVHWLGQTTAHSHI